MIKPLKKNSIVKIVEKQKQTAGGIILTSADPMEVTRGHVISIGPDVTEFGVGDYIMPNWQKARKTKIDGEEFFIIDEDDVVGVFEDVEEDGWVDATEVPKEEVKDELFYHPV
jgi:chaperonin GroES